MIREIQPKTDENGILIKKQEFCASCKRRLDCKILKDHLSTYKVEKDFADVFLPMYFVCDDYDSMFISYPIEVNKIVSESIFSIDKSNFPLGKWVLVKEENQEYPHIGLSLSLQPTSIISMYDNNNGTITNKFYPFPAFYMFYNKTIVYGKDVQWEYLNDNNITLTDDEDFLQDFVKKCLTKNF